MKGALLATILFVLSSSVILTSCNKTPTEPNNILPNLISNPNFDVNGQPSLQDWIANPNLAKVVRDTLPGGVQWCLQISPGWIPQEGFARTYVSGQSGLGVYKLSVWMKSTGAWQGIIKLGRWSQGGWSTSKQTVSDSTVWTQVTISDTISLQPTDSIAVHLSAGSTEVAFADVLCAEVTLLRIQ